MDKLLDRMIDYLYGRKLDNRTTRSIVRTGEPWEREALPSVWANSKGDLFIFVPDLTNLFGIQRIFLITHANAPSHVALSWFDANMQAWWRDVFRMLSILNFAYDYTIINGYIKLAKTKEDYERIEKFFSYEDKNITISDIYAESYYDNDNKKIARLLLSPFGMIPHKITAHSDLLDKYNPIDRTAKDKMYLLPLYLEEYEGESSKVITDTQIGDMLDHYYMEWEDVFFGRVPLRPVESIGTTLLTNIKTGETFSDPNILTDYLFVGKFDKIVEGYYQILDDSNFHDIIIPYQEIILGV